MTLFIDLRATPSGGICASEATLWDDGTQAVTAGDFASRIRGRDLILATHGFNVGRASGIESLSAWGRLLKLPATTLFIGILWPGDSRFFPVVDYPFEGDEAIASGRLLARFLNENAGGAASLSLVSHSLGARTVLEALDGMNRNVRRLILMAGAIEDDCLLGEYRQAAAKAQEICILASRSDLVLELAFPIGNLVGEIVMHGHPYFESALGRSGPVQPLPLEQRGGAWQIPDGWDFGHGDYVHGDPNGPRFAPPVPPPAGAEPPPYDPSDSSWKPSWSAGVVSTQTD
jgi:hypothetical protein